MKAAAAGVAARGVVLPTTSSSSSQPSRKEWRVVSELSGRSSCNEVERTKLGLSDERLIYEVQQGREPDDVDFCSITIEGSLDNDILQRRLQSVVKQREELQHMELELRAQIITRNEILEIQNSFDSQIKEHTNANVNLQEQLHGREKKIHELERKIEEKERELQSVRLDTEAAWAKEELIREQSKELQTYRRERDNSEVEKAQHIKQINDLQERFQEKDRQFMELQEKNRITQETILFKDEQLREARAWISHVQERDALQSSSNHSLQSELRERTEQYNQLWLGCQRQFGEMERLRLHIQQLQVELDVARERNGTCADGSHVAHTNSEDLAYLGQNNGGQVDVSRNGLATGNSGDLPNRTVDNATSSVSGGNASPQNDHVHGVQIPPTSIFGMPNYLPHGQVTPLHPFIVHHQEMPHSVPSHISQTHVSQFHTVPMISALEAWQNQQATSEGQHMPTDNLETDLNLLRSHHGYETLPNGQIISSEHSEAFELLGRNYLGNGQSQQSMQQMASQFHDALRLDPLEHNNKNREDNGSDLANHEAEAQGPMTEQNLSADLLELEAPNHAVNSSNSTMNAIPAAVLPEPVSTAERSLYVEGKPGETLLLDERSLLACIVRTIPPGAGGRIRISSTLPNRLTKMLAPLHWHDYKRKYGKLDDFVASHPELFLVDGDYVQLREGAHKIVASTAAVAKVAAATSAATPPHSSLLPFVALTPMATSLRLKKVPGASCV